MIGVGSGLALVVFRLYVSYNILEALTVLDCGADRRCFVVDYVVLVQDNGWYGALVVTALQ